MFQKSRFILAGTVVAAALAGCRSNSGCRDGTCGAARRTVPAAASPEYVPSNPTYAPSDGSGTRMPVAMPPGGGGFRGEGSGSR